MRAVIYSEWVPAGAFMKIIVVLVSVIILFVLSIPILTDVAFQNPLWIAVSGSVLAFLLLMFRNFRGIKIQVSDRELQVNYGIFNHKSIPLETIVSCELTKASFRRYGGVGVRLGIDGSWAYTTSFGDAVKIIPRKGRPFVFSSNNSNEICNILNQIKNKTSGVL